MPGRRSPASGAATRGLRPYSPKGSRDLDRSCDYARRMGTHRIVSAGVVLAGSALAVSPLLPWAGVRAEVPLLGRGLGVSVLGFDDTSGWFVFGAGVVAAVLGVAGLLSGGRAVTGLALIPGAAGTLALAVFLDRPEHGRERFIEEVLSFLAVA